jgi:acyl carrier protein
MTLVERIQSLTPTQRVSLLERLAPLDAPGEKEIAAYVVSKPGTAVAEEELRTFLATRLPDFMIPKHFVFLNSLPLNPNGKVDRKALPTPFAKASAPITSPAPAAHPGNEIEAKLTKIWSELLRVEQIGPDDNFFRLGGHSLLALQVMARVRDTFKADLPLKTLFDFPTVAGLAKAIADRANQGGSSPIKRVARPVQPAPGMATTRFTT